MKTTTKKIAFYKADQIMDTKYPMFDEETNRIFGTIAVFLVKEDGEPTGINEEKRCRVTGEKIYRFRELNEEQKERAKKIA